MNCGQPAQHSFPLPRGIQPPAQSRNTVTLEWFPQEAPENFPASALSTFLPRDRVGLFRGW